MTPDRELTPSLAPRWRASDLAAALGDRHAVPVEPVPVPGPHWVARSGALARELGLQTWLDTPEALDRLAGGAAAGQAPTRATAYSGHQFGAWAGQLGDGRALLLGELDTPAGPVEVQLKGSGLTPFSRMGDGRAVLRSSIREFLASEAMHALGIPTTRALAIVGSPLPVRRETIETAALVTRVASSFVRFGHFEHFTHTAEDPAALQRLADWVIARHYPALAGAPQPYAALLREVTLRTAELMAHWQAVGFCHGVMNTDNMSIAGLTLDYGPFGFMDAFDPGHICNHTDQGGRYAYARQPNVAFWNLHALAQGLMPLIGEPDDALAALEVYKSAFPEALLRRMRAKLGLRDTRDEDRELVDDLLRLMAAGGADFTITFRRLAMLSIAPSDADAAVRDLFIDRPGFDAWAARYRVRLRAEGRADAERAEQMNRTNPKFVLRNHLAEVAIESARGGDFAETERLLAVLERPFDEQPGREAYAAFPPDWARQLEVSCSS